MKSLQEKEIWPKGMDKKNGCLRMLSGGMLFFILFICILFVQSMLWAAGPEMIRDINPFGSSNPSSLFEMKGVLYFTADDGRDGRELWKSDGTKDGTVLVKDILSGPGSSRIDNFFNVSDILYFGATTDGQTWELWKSDGTKNGTMALQNIGQRYLEHASMDNILYFNGYDASHGHELWKSDGTVTGTSLVKDIVDNVGDSDPASMVVINDKLYFSADSGSSFGRELWTSDGTEAGTKLLSDIWPGEDDSNPRNLTNVDGTLYFVACDGASGFELWKSNGSVNGTMLVKDIDPDNIYYESSYFHLMNVNGILYFFVNDRTHGLELWKSSGTDASTKLVKDIYPGPEGSIQPNYNWFITSMDGILYFSADDGVHGYELWRSDGTEAGTWLVKDIFEGREGSCLSSPTIENHTLYFTACDGSYTGALWKSDGTAVGTVRLAYPDAICPTNDYSDLICMNGYLYFSYWDSYYSNELRKYSTTFFSNSTSPWTKFLPAILGKKQ